MIRCSKIVITAIVMLPLLALLHPVRVFAQPLGIMSQPQQQPQHGALGSSQGRFVFGQISGASGDKFMLDTFTGRLWRISESGEVGLFLDEIPYQTGDGEYSPLPDNGSAPKPKKGKGN